MRELRLLLIFIVGFTLGFGIVSCQVSGSGMNYVTEDKEWKVTFNKDIRESRVEEHVRMYVGIEDEREVGTRLRVEGNIMYIEGAYEKGSYHTLEIKKGLRAEDGSELGNGERIVFKVNKEGNDESISGLVGKYIEDFEKVGRFGSEYDFDWKAYENERGELMLVGENGEGLRSFFTNKSGAEFHGIRVGRSVSRAEGLMEELDSVARSDGNYHVTDENIRLFRYASGFVYVYVDNLDNERVVGFRLVRGSEEESMQGFYGRAEEVYLDSERLMGLIMNSERKTREVSELVWDGIIGKVARDHSSDMVERDFFGHENPDGENVMDRVDKVIPQLNVVGENLAFGQVNPIDAHYSLLNSRGHRDNMLSNEYGGFGVGIDFDDEGVPYYTVKMYR